jgi:phosphoglycolate phosphatase-like HAD superfamily hydrolase
MPSEDSKQILETIRSFAQREEHYLRMIEELKREQLGMQDTYHRQIEEVRTHLIDLKERGVPVAAAS